MIWVFIGVYVAGWLVTMRTYAIRELDQVAQDELQDRRNLAARYREEHREWLIASKGPLTTERDRAEAIQSGMLAGAIWPVFWIHRAAVVSVYKTGLESPTELAESERRELVALRQLAREHNLPMPGGE